jgi:hypothetical protein
MKNERSEAKSANESFASKVRIPNILTRSIASRFELRYALPFTAKLSAQLIGQFTCRS